MDISLWCAGAYSTLLTAFCFTSATLPSIPSAEQTATNTLLSGIVSGQYAGEAVADSLENIPILNLLPLEALSLEDEFAHMIQKESARYARSLVNEELGHLGLGHSLALPGPMAPPSHQHSHARSAKSQRRVRLSTRISTRRLGLSLIFRF
ncbi:MAG: hypothetical protein HYT79_08890 [Elusimicrobia bacterium]|nr:hypothetical protein [Elusimicrobiota bacterium]